MKNHKINTFCPVFSGFYESFLDVSNSQDIDHDLFNNPESVKPEILEYILNALWSENLVDTKKIHIDTSKNIVNQLNSILKDEKIYINFTFQALVSPKYYNYSDDSINILCKFNKKHWKKIINEIKNNIDLFEEHIKDNYTSCSGFISSFSDNFEWWIEQGEQIQDSKDNEHLTGALLNFYFTKVLDINEESLYSNIVEKIYFSEYVDYNKLIELVNTKFNLNIKELEELATL